MLQTLLLVSGLAVQQMNCFPLDIQSNDRAVFSWQLPVGATPTEGTLFLTSGLDDFGNSENTGILPLSGGSTTADGKAEYVAENLSSRFKVSLDAAVFGKAARNVSVRLQLESKEGTQTADEELTCYTNVYSAEDVRR